MRKITTSMELKSAIQELEAKQAREWPLLKDQFLAVVETLKPVNLIRDTVKKFISSPDLKANVIHSFFGLTTGAVATKLFTGITPNPISKLIVGAIVGLATSAGASKAVNGIKSLSGVLFKKIFRRKHSEKYNGNFI